ncbi:MAG: OmpA family protein [Polyangiaceae bacterium]|nr:OmpA family protein [Polyangiaceae bacterium]
MRKYVAPFLCAVMMVGTAVVAGGCTAEARIGSGPKEPEAKPVETPPPAETTAAPEQPKPKYSVEGGQLKLPGPVVFETGKATLKPESDEVLQIVHDYLKDKPDITLLRIEGHTDTDGNDADNQRLSEGRSLAVAQWLVAKGIDCKRLIPVGFGETKPVAANDTPENKAQNRRTAFVNAALKGKPIGGMPVDGGGKVAGDPCK